LRHLLERAGFFEEMRRPCDDGNLGGADELAVRGPIEPQHFRVRTADDKQSRRLYFAEELAGQIGASTARNHRGDQVRELRCNDQRSRRAGARAEQPDRQLADIGLFSHPTHGIREAPAQQRDVETVLTGQDVDAFLVARQQIEKQRAEPCLAEERGNCLVASTEAAAAAAMRKHDDARRVIRNVEES
jgi:hypothetical protein